MKITLSFVHLLRDLVQVVTGWLLSRRHRTITEVIFAGSNVGNEHWCHFQTLRIGYGELNPATSSSSQSRIIDKSADVAPRRYAEE